MRTDSISHDDHHDDDDDNFVDAEDDWSDGYDEWTAAADIGDTLIADKEVSKSCGSVPHSSASHREASLALHRAAFYDCADEARRLMGSLDRRAIKALDPQGNTALHVAVQRESSSVIEDLLELQFPAHKRSSTGWTAAHDAAQKGNRALTLQLLQAEVESEKRQAKSKYSGLLQAMRELPDFSMQIHWEIGSSMPGVGLLLRTYLPHDTYTIWKKGDHLRIDGALMGIQEESTDMIPRWDRGHFSLLLDGSQPKVSLLFVDHTKKTFADLNAMKKKSKKGSSAKMVHDREADADLMLEEKNPQRTGMKTVDFKFEPAMSWFRKELTEKVEGWQTKVYEASGRLMSVTKTKACVDLSGVSTFEEYLAMEVRADSVSRRTFNPFEGKQKAKGKKPPQGKAVEKAGSEADATASAKSATAAMEVQPTPSSANSSHSHTAIATPTTPHTNSTTASLNPTITLATTSEPAPTIPPSTLAVQPPGPPSSLCGDGSDTDGGMQSLTGSEAGHHPHPGDAPLSVDGAGSNTSVAGPGASGSEGAGSENDPKGRKVSARCWLAQEFPMSMMQLMPLLDVVGTANKTIGKVATFMRKYGSQGAFPVKIQVPVIMTLHVLLAFQKFKLMSKDAESTTETFYSIPEGFTRSEEPDPPNKPAAGVADKDVAPAAAATVAPL